MKQLLSRPVVSWAFYDWANSAFATTIMAGFFPIFFKQYWSAGADVTVSTFRLGLANSIASLTIAILAPLLGAIADTSARKKSFLGLFACLGILMTAGLFLVEQGNWQFAVLLYVGASLGFLGGNIFYDSLIHSVSDEQNLDRVSALGFALGYLGGGLLFAVNVAFTLKPEWFGLADAAEAVRWSFVTVAVWWALFAIPLFRYVKEPPASVAVSGLTAIRGGFRQLRQTFSQIRRMRVIALFLGAYWLYIDGVDTIVVMAVDYGMSLGFAPESLIVALLITQFVGFPAALVFGQIGARHGPKTGIYIALAVYLVVTVWGAYLHSETQFYVLAAVLGLVQGGIQSLSRSLYARIIPPDQSAEFFGFYGLLGKFAAIIGPALVGVVSYSSGSPRIAILSIAILFIIGGLLLARVDVEEGRRNALLVSAGNQASARSEDKAPL